MPLLPSPPTLSWAADKTLEQNNTERKNQDAVTRGSLFALLFSNQNDLGLVLGNDRVFLR